MIDRKRGSRGSSQSQRPSASRRQHAREEPAGDAIGKADDRRTPSERVLHERHEPANAGLCARRLDAHADRRSEVHRAGRNSITGLDRDRSGLAGEQGVIDLRQPGDHDASHGHRSARADLDHLPRAKALDRDLASGTGPAVRVFIHKQRAGRRQREENLDRVCAPPLLTVLDKPANQQQEDQHAQRVEVDLARPADRVGNPPCPARAQRQRDRHVQVHRACAQRGPRRAEEHRARPHQGDYRDAHAGPSEQRGVGRFHHIEQPRVQRKAEQHDVPRARPSHADTNQLPAVLATTKVAVARIARRVGRVAERIKSPRDARQVDSPGVPHDTHDAASKIQPRFHDALAHPRQFLHQPDARRAVHALQEQLAGPQPMSRRGPRFRRPAVQLGERGIIKLGVSGTGRLGRRAVFPIFQLFAQRVIAVQPARLDHGVRGAATCAAELFRCAMLDKTCRDCKPAVRARRCRELRCG